MRIDSFTYFNSSLAGIRDNQSGIARLSQQIAADRKLLAPKDDPQATEKILELSNRVAARGQFLANQDKASIALKYETTVLAEMHKTLSDARALIAGQSPSFDASLRDVHARNLGSLAKHLLSLANTQDPSGNYIFGGHDTNDAPFGNPLNGSGSPTDYDGTPITSTANPAGTRNIELDTGRYIQINDNLNTVFQATERTDGGGLVGGSVVTGPDLLQELDDAVATLPGAALTEADINGWVTVIDTALTRLDAISHRVAAAYGEVEDVRATSKALLLLEQNALSDLQSLDKASAIMELQNRQTALEAAEQAYAMTAKLSLFSYLS